MLRGADELRAFFAATRRGMRRMTGELPVLGDPRGGAVCNVLRYKPAGTGRSCVSGTEATSANKTTFEWNQIRVHRTEDFEHPRGEWNTIEIVVRGDTIEHYVNGHLVNRATGASVTRGRILLQSEGAEIFFRRVELQPL
jgi:hypothetical protein